MQRFQQFNLLAWLSVAVLGISFAFSSVVNAQSLDVDSTITDTPHAKVTYTKPLQRDTTSKNPYLTPVHRVNQSALPTENASSKARRAPFQLKATQTRTLPPEMYGQWGVTATLLKTDIPNQLPNVVHDIWQFEESGDVVALSNPNTGAYAAIHVDQVKGNWATFHHRVVIKPGRKLLLEQPAIMVKGDRMLGKTTHTYVYMKKGQVQKTYTAVFRIDAVRLSNSRVQFDERPKLSDQDFQVDDIQVELETPSPETIDSSLYVQ